MICEDKLAWSLDDTTPVVAILWNEYNCLTESDEGMIGGNYLRANNTNHWV